MHQARFRGFWEQVATAFADAEGVLGYELINEPLPGDYFSSPSMLQPGNADLKILQATTPYTNTDGFHAACPLFTQLADREAVRRAGMEAALSSAADALQ